MSFARMELLIDVDNRILVKSVTQIVPVQASTRPKFIYADTLILACSHIDKDGNAYPLNAGDTFDCGLDDDFEHNIDTGTTAAGYSGAVTSIQASGLTQQSLIPSTGHIVLINGADESDRVAYTAFDGTDTFTVSTTLSNTYLLGDEVQVQDDLMAYSDDTQVDIAGDWDDIDRATGKISIRINCLTDSFLRKIAEGDANGQLLTWLQIRRVPNGETEYTTMMQDYCYSYDSVIGSLGGAGNTFIDYITQTQGDARWLKIGEGVLGPGSSTDNAIMRWNGTAGADAQNSAVTIDDSGNTTYPATVTNTAATSLTASGGGKTLVLTSAGAAFSGDIYGDGWLRLANGKGFLVKNTSAAYKVGMQLNSSDYWEIGETHNVGIGTSSAEARLEVEDTTVQFRTTYANGSVYTDHYTNISGYHTIDPSGGQVIIDGSLTLTAQTPSWVAGQQWYDDASKTTVCDTGYDGVRGNLCQELHRQVTNRSGAEITNGKVVKLGTVDGTTGFFQITLAGANDTNIHSGILFVATMDIADDGDGMCTKYGEVNDASTTGLVAGQVAYLSTTPGDMTATAPPAPSALLEICRVNVVHASAGKFTVDIDEIHRTQSVVPLSFTSQGVSAGVYYADGGYYKAPDADVTLSQGSLTQTYGSANIAYSAHAFIVAAGGATVNAGTVGIKVQGTSITDAGVRTTTDEEILTADITSLSTDDYLESAKKWIGQITFALYDSSGTPATYTVDLNYGLSKYEDVMNQNYTLAGVQIVGLGGANDSAANFEVIHHTSTGWTYSAGAFVPGPAALADMITDLGTESNIGSGEEFCWKRDNLSTLISGADSEGALIRITTAQNNTIQSLNGYIAVFVEED